MPGQSAGPGQRVLRPASASAVHRRMLIARSSQSQPALSSTSCRPFRPPLVLPAPGPCGPVQALAGPAARRLACARRAAEPPDTQPALRPGLFPAREAPARVPCGAGPAPGIPGRDAGTLPARVAARQRRELGRPQQLPHEASRTWPRELRIPHTSGLVTPIGKATETAWPFCRPAYSAGASAAPGTVPGISPPAASPAAGTAAAAARGRE